MCTTSRSVKLSHIPVHVLVHVPAFRKLELRVRRTSTASLWTCTRDVHGFAVCVPPRDRANYLTYPFTYSSTYPPSRNYSSCTENEYRSAVDVYEGRAWLRGECLPPRDRSNYLTYPFTYSSTYPPSRNWNFVYGERVPLRCGRVRGMYTASRCVSRLAIGQIISHTRSRSRTRTRLRETILRVRRTSTAPLWTWTGAQSVLVSQLKIPPFCLPPQPWG